MSWEEKLIIIEKYDEFLHYIYPVLQKITRTEGILKEDAIELIFGTPELIYRSIKSPQISKMYDVDIRLSVIRHRIRFLSDDRIKVISEKQSQVSQVKLGEVGRIVGKMISNQQKGKEDNRS